MEVLYSAVASAHQSHIVNSQLHVTSPPLIKLPLHQITPFFDWQTVFVEKPSRKIITVQVTHLTPDQCNNKPGSVCSFGIDQRQSFVPVQIFFGSGVKKIKRNNTNMGAQLSGGDIPVK